MCPLRVKPSLAHLDRQLATPGELLPERLLPRFVLEMYTCLVVQLLMVLHKVHNSLLISISQIDIRWSCAPSCKATVMVPPLLQQPLSQCHFFLPLGFFLSVPPLESVFPPLFPPTSLPPPPSVAVVMPPPSLWPPFPRSSAGYPPLCPPVQIQEHCQWELLSSSLFCLSWDPLSNNKQHRFHKKQNPKV